ncbi:MAG: hypothetical protein ACKOX2_01765, partial [Microcystaceae cyanobacterium]
MPKSSPLELSSPPSLQTTDTIELDPPLTTTLALRSRPWTIEDSEKLYRINGWGDPYFSINA